jgi:hypothetical protein
MKFRVEQTRLNRLIWSTHLEPPQTLTRSPSIDFDGNLPTFNTFSRIARISLCLSCVSAHKAATHVLADDYCEAGVYVPAYNA